MTRRVALRLGGPICMGGCGLSASAHRRGRIFLDVVHFADRRFTKRALRNLLLLIARQRRERDPEFLNDEMYDWYYQYLDSVEAARLARSLGVVLPSRLFDQRRALCRALAARRGVKLSRRKEVYSWLQR